MLTFKEIHLQFKNARSEKDLAGIAKVWRYLDQRGISRETAGKLGLFILSAMELIAAARRSPNVMPDTRAAVVFPHYQVADDEAIEWWSSRLVDLTDEGPRVVASFGDLVDPEKRKRPGKMFCPPNEAPRGYLTPLCDWANIPQGARVYIHESCIKAINGALLGKYSVGLNGVWGWTSQKNEIALIAELRDLPWKARALEPVIVFDANARTNWQVQAAENRLAAKLFAITGRSAVALRVPHPDAVPLGDQGFDDFRMSVGDRVALEFLEGAGEPIDVSQLEQMLVKLNSEVCVVRDIGRIAEQETGTLMSRATFTDVNFAHYMAEVPHGDDVRMANVPKIWITDTRRVEVESIAYMPGHERIDVDVGGGPRKLNLWKGMGCEPEPGDVDVWLRLLTNNVGDEWLRNWIISWCAYPLQNLGSKMNSLLLLFGPSGVGKNLFLDPLRAIYGDNAVLISEENLRSAFNSVYSKKQLVHVDELPRVRSDFADSGGLAMQKIKLLTTSKKITVNTKNQPEYEVRNCANLALTSNYHDCIKLDQDDRRACVIKWEPQSADVDHRGDQPYWVEYVRWSENEGPAALYQFLLEWDIKASGFDPHAWAPHTEWKDEITEAGMSPMDLWAKDLWRDPEFILPLIGQGRALWSAKELAMIYWGCSESEITHGRSKSLTNALKNQGFSLANGGNPLKPQGRDGVQARFWVVRRRDDDWSDAKTCSSHLRQFFK